MRFVLAGASGFLGSAWADHLRSAGHEVTRLVRRAPDPGEVQWDPYAGRLDPVVVENADVVANLAGSSLVGLTRLPSYQRTLRDSRVVTTRVLAEAIAATDRKPAFLAQNGIAGYGDRGDEVVTEDDPTGADTLMGRVTAAWEAAASPAAEAGARVVVMRTAVVLDRRGTALKAMRVPFLLGLGGRVGSGRQYFSTITLRDWVRAATFLAESDAAAGPYNLTGPAPTTNAEFTRALARELHRPALIAVPAIAIKTALGPVASELLGSIRLEPRRLSAEGFVFQDPTLADRLRTALA